MVQSIRPQDASGVYRRNLAGMTAAGGAPAQRASAGAGRPRRTDSVALSSEALLLARSLQAAHGAPELREDLVAQLRASVQDGSYRLDARRIAGQLLAPAAGAEDTPATERAQA